MKDGDETNRRRRELAAQKRERKRAAQWAEYKQNPQATSLRWNEQLRAWLTAKGWKVRKLARELSVNARSVFDWLRAEHPPVGWHKRRLYEITGLECFDPLAGLPDWAKVLSLQATAYIESLPTARNTKKQYGNFAAKILERLVQRHISTLADVTPTLLFQSPPNYKSNKVLRHSMGFFGRLLLARGFWTETQERELEQLLSKQYPQKYKPQRSGRPAATTPATPLLKALVRGCGLRIADCGRLRLANVTTGGISLEQGRTLQYGDGPHRVGRDLVDRWVKEAGLVSAKDSDYLFFQRTPRDPRKPAGRAWLAAQLRNGDMNGRGHTGPHIQHFQDDYERLGDSARARFHFMDFHGMGRNRSLELLGELQARIGVYLPVPFLVGIVAVGQLVDCTPTKLPGGRALTYAWPDLNGYKVCVQWPASFHEMLKDGRVKPGIARDLLRLGAEACWEANKIQGAGRFENLNSTLAEKLRLVVLEIQESKSGFTWQGAILSRRPTLKVERTKETFRLRPAGKSTRFDLPLLQALKGGPTNGRCTVCRHEDRAEIDKAILNGNRPSEIARQYALPYSPSEHHLLWHMGRLKGKTGHVGPTPLATLVRLPTDFLARVARENAPNLARKILFLH